MLNPLTAFLTAAHPYLGFMAGLAEFILRFLANLLLTEYTWDPENSVVIVIGFAFGLTIIQYLEIFYKALLFLSPRLALMVEWFFLYLEEFLHERNETGKWPKNFD